MRKMIVTNISSIEGYYEGPGANVMALPMDDRFDAYNAERPGSADTLLLGRTTYELLKSFWPPVADDPEASDDQREISRRDNAIEKVVVSDSLTEEDIDPWRETTQIVRRADADRDIEELKEASDGVVHGGGTLTFGDAETKLRLLDTRRFEGSENLLVRSAAQTSSQQSGGER